MPAAPAGSTTSPACTNSSRIARRMAALGHRRNVVLSASSFLFVPELVAQSDFVALVPQRLVADRANLRMVDCPFPVDGFEVGMVWHERNHGHSGQRWVRETLGRLAAA